MRRRRAMAQSAAALGHIRLVSGGGPALAVPAPSPMTAKPTPPARTARVAAYCSELSPWRDSGLWMVFTMMCSCVAAAPVGPRSQVGAPARTIRDTFSETFPNLRDWPLQTSDHVKRQGLSQSRRRRRRLFSRF